MEACSRERTGPPRTKRPASGRPTGNDQEGRLRIPVAVHGVHRESRNTNRNVFGAAFARSGVAHPLPSVGDHRLSGGDVECASCVLHAQRAFENDRELIELGSLAGLDPSLRAAHVRDAGRRRFGIDASDVFINQLGFVACGWNTCWLRDKCRHRFRTSERLRTSADLLNHGGKMRGWLEKGPFP
jgi:hypothetical protein